MATLRPSSFCCHSHRLHPIRSHSVHGIPPRWVFTCAHAPGRPCSTRPYEARAATKAHDPAIRGTPHCSTTPASAQLARHQSCQLSNVLRVLQPRL